MSKVKIKHCSVIGKIPGYNVNIDPTGHYQNILLRDLTYIDLLPATYKINLIEGSKPEDFKIPTGSLYQYKSGVGSSEKTGKIFTSVLSTMGTYLLIKWKDAFKKSPANGAQNYSSLYGTSNADKMRIVGEGVIEEFKKTQSIRILAANDSTFTETISNSYSPKGTLENISSGILGKTGLAGAAGLMQKVQSLSYDKALNTLTNFSSNGSMMDIVSGKLLGLQFASPNAWQESSYAGTLSLFIKLASPSGDPLSILKHITIPILTLMGAGAPLTKNGLTYGMPLIWDVRAYGITRFKVGALAALTISRGSYETVFNADKQPLLVDVRLTIMPLVQDFAVQYSDNSGCASGKAAVAGARGVGLSNKEVDKLGSKVTGMATSMTKAAAGGATGEGLLSAFMGLMTQLVNTMGAAVKCIGGESISLYGNSGLGVQSPGDEIDGLMGLTNDHNSARANDFPDIAKTHLYTI